jgi:hypothetical protein
VKLSGHFVYASVSDMADVPPLRCTNRCAQQQGCGWYRKHGRTALLMLLICAVQLHDAALACLAVCVPSSAMLGMVQLWDGVKQQQWLWVVVAIGN